tara:strand:+ start:863 stop:964 length:102 start_codon:yes stop_codon:yes gene_type:complete
MEKTAHTNPMALLKKRKLVRIEEGRERAVERRG